MIINILIIKKFTIRINKNVDYKFMIYSSISLRKLKFAVQEISVFQPNGVKLRAPLKTLNLIVL